MSELDIAAGEARGTSRAVVGASRGALRVPGAGDLIYSGYGSSADETHGYIMLWNIILKWRWIVIGVFAAVLGISIAVTFLTTPIYRAKVTMEISSEEVRLIDTADSKSQSVVLAQDDYLQTQYALLMSRSLAERVARNLNLGSEAGFGYERGGEQPANADEAVRRAAGEVLSGLIVRPVSGSRIVEVMYDHPSRSVAVRVANGVAQAFIQSTLDRRMGSTTQTRAIVAQRLAEAKSRLEASERAAQNYARQAGIVSLSSESTADGQAGSTSLEASSLSALNNALAQAQQDRITAEQRYRQSSRATTEELSNSTIQGLLARRAELTAEMTEKANIYRDNYPQMVQLRSRIADIDNSLNRERSRIRTALSGEYQAAAARESELRARVAGLRGDVLNLNDRGIQFGILRREVDTNRQLYDALLNRFKEVDIASDTGTTNVSVVDSAQSASQIRPNPLFNIALGAALGLVLGLIGAFISEFMDDTIKTPDDLTEKIKIPLLGVVPKLASSMAVVEESLDPGSMVSEAYFSIRTAMEFGTSHGAPRSMLITSSRPSEGKSVSAFAIANAFARTGAKVLLIDADMRKPTLKIGEEGGGGFSNALAGQADFSEFIFATATPNLSVMPSGAIPPNPAELLASRRTAEVIADLMDRYDHVILDGPPVMAIADAPLISSLTEATIFVVEGGVRRLTARRAVGRLIAADAQILGGYPDQVRCPR